MKLAVVNGSPKARGGNTEKLVNHFLAGVMERPTHDIRMFSVTDFTREIAVEDVFGWADDLLLAFPLYTDAMPSGVNRFIQRLGGISQQGPGHRPRLLFLVQSGFIEAAHSRGLERYLEKLSKRLNCGYTGTIIRGGLDSVNQFLPPVICRWVIRRMEKSLRKSGRHFAQTGNLDPKRLRQLSFPETMPALGLWFFKAYAKVGIRYLGFDRDLKQARMFENRDAGPYN